MLCNRRSRGKHGENRADVNDMDADVCRNVHAMSRYHAGMAIDRALLDEAVDLLRQAGDLTLRWFRSRSLEVERKKDGTPVTEADRAAERFLREMIAQRHPNDSIIGEEEPTAKGSSGRTWIIDPIDGTKSFTHGVPLFSNLLAVLDEDGPAIGVINLPALGETVFAGRGLGCFDRNGPVHVNESSSMKSACVCTSGIGSWDAAPLLALKNAGPLVRTWGDGYGFALLATGRIEAMVDPRVSLWDVAPMPVIVREAGGRYTDLRGDESIPLDRSAVVSAVATNGAIHDELLRILRV